MSGVLNDCDALLQAASVRILNPKDAFIYLTPSAPGFHLNSAGVADLSVVTVTADLIALDGDIVFSGQGVTLSNVKARSVDATYVSGTGIVTATVVTNGDTFARSLVIPVLRDGASTPGARGAGHYYVTGSTWSDIAAQAACPGGPVVNDVVTISSGTFVGEKRWTGSAWIDNGVVINGKLIVPDSILASAIDTRGLTVKDATGKVLLGVGVPLDAALAAPGTKNSEQQWVDVQGIPYSTITNNDDSVALGFNPSFADWTAAAPAGWSGTAPVKELTIKRPGQRWAARFNPTGTTTVGMNKRVMFPALPLGTFISGAYDVWVDSVAGGNTGKPGLMVRLWHATTPTNDYTDVPFPASTTALQQWQRIHFTARAATKTIIGIEFYLFGAYSVSGFGPWFSGSVIFDNFRFGLFDSSLDNKTITIAADGSLGNAGSGKVTITGLGYTGELDATNGADATNLKVGVGKPNLIPSNSLPNDIGTFIRVGTMTGMSGPFYMPPSGSYSQYSPKGQGNVYVTASGSPASTVYMDLYFNTTTTAIPVVAGKKYEAGVAISAHRCKAQMLIAHHAADDSIVSYSWGDVIENNPAEWPSSVSFPRSTVVFTAPANAVKSVLRARMTGNGGASPYMFTSHWYMAEALASQTVASPYSPGPEELVTSLQSKLPNADAILKGVLSLDATTVAGLRVGTLTWNAAGVRQSGYGTAMTPAGLVGYRQSNGSLGFKLGTDGEFTLLDKDGGTILTTESTLAQQAASNPNLVPGPRGWSTFYSGAYSWRNGNVVFGNGEYIGLAPASSAGGYIAAESPPCGAPAGATITVSFDASCDSGTRTLSLNFFGPSVDTTAYSTVLTTTFKRYVWTITLPNVADAPKAFLRMWSSAVGAQIIISNIKVEMGSKATPWCDNAITADNVKNRVFIPNLAALTAYVGNMEIGPGGALWQGMSEYSVGTGMWFGQHGGINKFFVGNLATSAVWWDGSTLNLQSAKITAPFSVSLPALFVNLGNTSTYSTYTMTPTFSGATGTISKQWTFSPEAGDISMAGEADADSFKVKARGTNISCSGYVTLTAIDGNGAIARATRRVAFNFGAV